MPIDELRDDETFFFRGWRDTLRRIERAIIELDRLDAGLGASVPGHSIRDAAHDLRVLRDELRKLYTDGD